MWNNLQNKQIETKFIFSSSLEEGHFDYFSLEVTTNLSRRINLLNIKKRDEINLFDLKKDENNLL